MKALHLTSLSFSIVCILAIGASPRALSQGTGGNAKLLLEEARKKQHERKLSAKQTELDRLSEDLKKGKQEIDDLQQSISKVGSAVSEANGQLDRLSGQKKTSTQELELVNLRIEAEKLKAEGLKLLSSAHAKAMEAQTKRIEELDLRTTLVAAEIRQISGTGAEKAPESGPKGKNAKAPPTVSELRRQLAKAENATSLAASRAREAMDAATTKLQQADAAAAKAEKKQTEVSLEKNPGFPGGNDPLSKEVTGAL
jgi:uncharacterized protein YoxC